MKIDYLLQIFESELKDAITHDEGLLNIRKVKEYAYAKETASFIDKFLSQYPQFSGERIQDLLYYLYEIRTEKPLPMPERGRGEFRARGAENSFANAVYNFIKNWIISASDDEANIVRREHAQKISRYRQFLEKVKDLKIGDFEGGIDAMISRFEKTKGVYEKHKTPLIKMKYRELIHIPLLLQTANKKNNKFEVNIEEFKRKVYKVGGGDDIVNAVISTFNDMEIIDDSGIIDSSGLEEMRKTIAEIDENIKKNIKPDASRVDIDKGIASTREGYYKQSVAAANKLIPQDLMSRVMPIVNQEIAGKGYNKIYEHYDNYEFRNTLAGALYTALVIQQSAANLRATLNSIKNNKSIPPVNRWKQRKDKLRFFDPQTLKNKGLLNPNPNHPMVKAFKKINLS